MKARFGGLLAIALGTVLIVNGVSSADGGTVGVGTPPPAGTCGSQRAFGAGIIPVDNCPNGSIVVTETTTGSVTAPAAGWEVTVTSTCLDTTGTPVDRTVTVADGGSVTLDGLYIFPTDGATADTPKCQYALAETPVAGVTATFDPESPVEIGYDDNDQNKRTVAVALANTADAPESSTPPSATVAPSESAAPTESGPSTDFTDTAAGSASAGAGDEGAGGGAAAPASAAPIAQTGPSQPITASLWLGIGLVFLGLFLLFEGRIRRLGKHRT